MELFYMGFTFSRYSNNNQKKGHLIRRRFNFARKRMKSRVATPKKLDKQVLNDLFFTLQQHLLIFLWVSHLQCCYGAGLILFIKRKFQNWWKSTPTNYAVGSGGLQQFLHFSNPTSVWLTGNSGFIICFFLTSFCIII